MLIGFCYLRFDQSARNGDFLPGVLERLSGMHPEHTFLFISDKTIDASLPKNVIPVQVECENKSPVKWLLSYHLKLRKILKKYQADILITEQFCSLTTKVPQILLSPDLQFVQQNGFLKKKILSFYKRFTPRFLKKAKTIIALSEFEKNELIKYFKTDPSKIKVISEGAEERIELVNTEEREMIKQQYAEGNEYFIYPGTISFQKNLKNLLKAFSAFKKRQRSGMQLLFVGEPGRQFEDFKESLELYKFKKEIKLLSGLSEPENKKLMASAYAIVYPVEYEMSANAFLKGMQYEVPVLASSSGAIPEFCGDASLYFQPADHKDIAEKMMEIFRDESLRKELIEKGKTRTQDFNWSDTADAFFKLIENAVAASSGTI
jgi:glycosyltransferase involved in cell wall biosynthesis